MLASITSALTQFLTWIGSVVTALTSSEGALAPLLPILVISVAASLLFVGIKLVRRICWGA